MVKAEVLMELRNLIIAYRKSREGQAYLVDVNAAEIVVCLVEY
jgi:hypothetical protein